MAVMQQINVTDVQATLPASDINRAKRWYGETLGLRPISEGDNDAMYKVGNSRLYLFESPGAGSNQSTAVTLAVDDAERAARELERAGVKLEQFDIPGAVWENGIAHRPDNRGVASRGGWFRDSEGNIIGFGEFTVS